jgi:Fe-S-cluster containining protein
MAEPSKLEEGFRAEVRKTISDLRAHGPFDALDRSRARHEKKCDEVLEQESKALACRKGCPFCCHLRVTLKAHEMFRITAHMASRFSRKRRDEILKLAQINLSILSSLSKRGQVTTNLRCPFLQDDACSIHEVRPASCRDFHSTDKAVCEYSFENPTDIESQSSCIEALRYVGTKWSEAASIAFAEAGFDPHTYELNSALVEAMTEGSSAKRFNHHKTAFLKAIRY